VYNPPITHFERCGKRKKTRLIINVLLIQLGWTEPSCALHKTFHLQTTGKENRKANERENALFQPLLDLPPSIPSSVIFLPNNHALADQPALETRIWNPLIESE
jgi:hypothetical protein